MDDELNDISELHFDTPVDPTPLTVEEKDALYEKLFGKCELYVRDCDLDDQTAQLSASMALAEINEIVMEMWDAGLGRGWEWFHSE